MNTRSFQQAVAWLLVALVAYFVYRVISAFLVPLTWAGIFTIFFFPLHRAILRRIRRRSIAALVSMSAVTVLLVAPAAWLIPTFVREAIGVIQGVPSEQFVPRVQNLIEPLLARLPVDFGSFEEIRGRVTENMKGRAGEVSALIASNVFGFLFDLIVMLLAMFYLFRDGPALINFLRDISPLGGDHQDRMVGEVSELISVTISSGIVVAAIQGLLGGLLFWSLGLRGPVLWGVMMALLAFLPFIGPWLVWGPAALGLILTGSTGRGVTLMVLGFFLVSGTDNILRPIMIADRSQLNGLLVFISVLGGVSAFGILGLVLGPLVVATAVGLMRGYRDSLREQTVIALADGGTGAMVN